MPTSVSTLRIGIFGSDSSSGNERHGCGLWPAGYAAAVTEAGGTPVPLAQIPAGRAGDNLLGSLQGVVFAEHESASPRQTAAGQRLCTWCRERRVPLLAVDRGLHLLNSSHGGNAYTDLPREVPEALQHRHPPERGLRHAISVEHDTRLAALYGDGEIIVNSEHRWAVCRVGRGFRVSARALDGVIEAIEAETDAWFAVGVQWQPASSTASGLDIQLFRGLVTASAARGKKSGKQAGVHAA